jgi:hypothetical protein
MRGAIAVRADRGVAWQLLLVQLSGAVGDARQLQRAAGVGGSFVAPGVGWNLEMNAFVGCGALGSDCPGG